MCVLGPIRHIPSLSLMHSVGSVWMSMGLRKDINIRVLILSFSFMSQLLEVITVMRLAEKLSGLNCVDDNIVDMS